MHTAEQAEVAKEIGADRHVYQELDDLIDAVTKGNPKLKQFDCSVFTGKYITGEWDGYFTDLEARRTDQDKKKNKENILVVDMSDKQN